MLSYISWKIARFKRKNMLHLIWYIIVGFIAGCVVWTILLGMVGSIIGGLSLIFFPRQVEKADSIQRN